MTTVKIAKMNQIFTPEFVSANKNVSDLEILFAKVAAMDSTVTREDFDQYIQMLSEQMHTEELDEASLETVAGGAIPWAAITAICGVITLCYKGGDAIGRAIYYASHK